MEQDGCACPASGGLSARAPGCPAPGRCDADVTCLDFGNCPERLGLHSSSSQPGAPEPLPPAQVPAPAALEPYRGFPSVSRSSRPPLVPGGRPTCWGSTDAPAPTGHRHKVPEDLWPPHRRAPPPPMLLSARRRLFPDLSGSPRCPQPPATPAPVSSRATRVPLRMNPLFQIQQCRCCQIHGLEQGPGL